MWPYTFGLSKLCLVFKDLLAVLRQLLYHNLFNILCQQVFNLIFCRSQSATNNILPGVFTFVNTFLLFLLTLIFPNFLYLTYLCNTQKNRSLKATAFSLIKRLDVKLGIRVHRGLMERQLITSLNGQSQFLNHL